MIVLGNAHCLKAQPSAEDVLKQKLNQEKNDTVRVKLLIELGEVIYQSNPDSAIYLWKKVETLVDKKLPEIKIKSLRYFYESYKANALGDIGFVLEMKGEMDEAIVYYNKALTVQRLISDKAGASLTLNNMGLNYYSQGNNDLAIKCHNEALILQKEIKDREGIARSFNHIGLTYDNQGNIEKALEYYHRSLKIREEINDKIGLSTSFSNIGLVYQHQGSLDKALEYCLKALKIQEELNDKEAIARSLNNIGAIYKDMKKVPLAVSYFQKALVIQEDLQDKKGMAYSYNNIGAVYNNKGDYKEAIIWYSKSLMMFEEIENQKGISYAADNLSLSLLYVGEVEKAFSLANRSLAIAQKLGFPESIMRVASTLNSIYQTKNDYKKALKMYELEIQMRDSISNQETRKAAVKKQLQYQYEKKAAADSVKNAEAEKVKNAQLMVQQTQLKQEKTQRFALYGGLILVIIFSGFVFNRFKITQKQKAIIEIKERETYQQKHLIEEKHKEITDSINYAERIQRSFLATSDLLDQNLTDYFVYFQPKDVVSGDFYWGTKLHNGNFVLVTADSTGHGVPGAIMSLLNITSLELAIKDKQYEPAEILNHTRQTIIERLKKDGSSEGGKDGMDCSLICFDFKNKKMVYSAANNPVWIVRENEILELAPDKMPVGKHDKDSISFTQHTIDLQTNDVVYALTDSMPDHFSGPKGKKYMYKQLKQLLVSVSQLPMAEQKQALQASFNEWKGDMEQVDDVCLIGVRV